MNDVSQDTIVILPRRGRLIAQAILIIAIGVVAGLGLQAWEVITTSTIGRIDETTAIPLRFITVVGMAAVLAWSILRPGLSHRLEIMDDQMILRERSWSLCIPYAQIEKISIVPHYGVGIALRDFESWISTQSQALAQQRVVSALFRKRFGVDLAILSKCMDRPVNEVVELIEQRCSALALTTQSEEVEDER